MADNHFSDTELGNDLPNAAANLFDKWCRANAKEQQANTGLYLSHLGKMPGMVLRLALTLEHLHWSISPSETPEPQSIVSGVQTDSDCMVTC